jgi:hypothetical protein
MPPAGPRFLQTADAWHMLLATIMNEYGQTEEQQPVMWLNGRPIYAAYFVVLVFVGSMLATTLVMALKLTGALGWLTFESAPVLRGEAWRVVTYGLVNPPTLFPFVVDMLMIAWFGREVERYFGRRRFLALFGCLYLLPPLLFTLIGVWYPMRLVGEAGTLGLFVAFAAIYPEAVLLFGILAKWYAAVFVGLYTLMALANRDLPGGLSLWATTGFAYGFVRWAQGRISLPSFRLFRRGPKLRVLPGYLGSKPEAPKPAKPEAMAEIDALLDKIARSGVSSLTAKERAQLDSARNELIKRGGRR